MAHLCGLVRWLLLIAVFNFVTSGSVDDVLGDQQVEGQKERPEHLFARSPSLASEEEADQDDQDGGTRDISDDMLRYLFDRTASELQARRAINHEEQRYNELMRPQPAVIGGQLVRQLPLDYDEEPENDEVAGDAMPGSIVYGDNGQGRLEIPDELYDYVMQANKGGRRVGAEPVPYMSSSNLREQATDDEIAEGLLDYLFEKTDDSDDEKMLLEPPEQQLDSHPSKYFTEQLTQNADLPEISDELLEYLLRKTMDEPEISDGQGKTPFLLSYSSYGIRDEFDCSILT
ncbi:hypothetical protein HDE_01968 [Halotydeus destructor]|nr:hypothetical protein HDE_01968 [Halotydeus destructor]